MARAAFHRSRGLPLLSRACVQLLTLFLYFGHLFLLTLGSPSATLGVNSLNYSDQDSRRKDDDESGSDEDDHDHGDHHPGHGDDDDQDAEDVVNKFWKTFGIVVAIVSVAVILLLICLCICARKRRKKGQNLFWTRENEIRAAGAGTIEVTQNGKNANNARTLYPQQSTASVVLPTTFSSPPRSVNQDGNVEGPTAPTLSPLNLQIDLDRNHSPSEPPPTEFYTQDDLPPPYDFSEWNADPLPTKK